MLTESELTTLRGSVRTRMSEGRYAHTLGVERAARRLGAILLPEREAALAAAALLHDVAKELDRDAQLELIAEDGMTLSDADRRTPALFHAFAAPALIRRDFARFATSEILSAVRWHTVGSPDMTLFDRIIFLSDYIEDTRSYPSCIAVREELYRDLASGEPPMRALERAMLRTIDETLQFLIKKGSFISELTLRTRNAILAGQWRD